MPPQTRNCRESSPDRQTKNTSRPCGDRQSVSKRAVRLSELPVRRQNETSTAAPTVTKNKTTNFKLNPTEKFLLFNYRHCTTIEMDEPDRRRLHLPASSHSVRKVFCNHLRYKKHPGNSSIREKFVGIREHRSNPNLKNPNRRK